MKITWLLLFLFLFSLIFFNGLIKNQTNVVAIGSQPPIFALDFTTTPSANVSILDNSVLRPENYDKFTWTAWIYLRTLTPNPLPFMIQKGPDYTCLMGDNTNFRFSQLGAETGSGAPSYIPTEYWGSTRLQTGVWYRYVFTFDHGTATHWLNGVPETISYLGQPYVFPLDPTINQPLMIGNSNNFNRNFGGLLARIHFYQNKILSSSEIANLDTPLETTDGLVGKWDFDEGVGTTVFDVSGNGNNGTITGASWVIAP